MLRRKHFVWLLVAALLLSLSVTGLAESTAEQVDNADGSYIVISKTDGVLTSKSYYAADGELVQHENYDAAGVLTSKHVYDGDTTQSTEYYPNGNTRSDSIQNDELRVAKYYSEAGVIQFESSMVYLPGVDYWEQKAYIEYNQDGIKVHDSSYEYDAGGNVIASNTLDYFDDGTLSFESHTVSNEYSYKEYYPSGEPRVEGVNQVDDAGNTIAATVTHYAETGTIEHEYVLDENGSTNTQYNPQGIKTYVRVETADGSESTQFYLNGDIKAVSSQKSDGSSEAVSYYLDGTISETNSETADGKSELISYNRDGTKNYSQVMDANNGIEETWYENGVITQLSVGEDKDGYREFRNYEPNENGELQLTSINKNTFEDGKRITETSTPNEAGEFVPTLLSIYTTGEDGVRRYENYTINAQGERTLKDTQESTGGDGEPETTNYFIVNEQGEEVLTVVTVTSDDYAGNWQREEYEVQADGQQILVEKYSSMWNETEGKREDQRSQLVDGQLIVTEQVITSNHEDGGFTVDTYELNEQGELVLVDSTEYAEDGGEIAKEEEEELPPQRVFTWYPSNTASSAGFSFRNLRPELTDKWYNFTPIDLGQDGTTVIPLVAGNVYIVGKVEVTVTGDEVLVGYSLYGAGNDTARMESEFFTFFANLDAVTTVNPEKLGEGYTFGQPISIEKDLQGDTKVLLFVRNVLTFRDYYTGERQLARYWPNSKNYNDYYDYLKSIMD